MTALVIDHAEWGMYWLRASRGVYLSDRNRAACLHNAAMNALHIMALEAVA